MTTVVTELETVKYEYEGSIRNEDKINKIPLMI